MNLKTKALVEGAFMAAIFLVLLFLTLYTWIGLLGFLLLPLPFIMYTARNGIKNTLFLGITVLFLMLPFNLLPLFPSVLYAWWVGAVVGIGFRKKTSALFSLLLTFLAILSYMLLFLFAAITFFRIDILGEVIKLVEESFTLSTQLIGQKSLEQFGPNGKERLLEQVRILFPSILILYSLLSAYFTQWIAKTIYRRLGGEVPPFPPFSALSFPKSVLFYFLGAVLLSFIPNLQETEWLYHVVENLFAILYFVLSLQGLFFLFYISREKRVGKWLPILGFILLFLPPLDTILRMLGIIDLGFPLRSRKGRG